MKSYPRTHVVWPNERMRARYNKKVKKDGYSHSKGLVRLAEMYLDGEVNLPVVKEVK